MLDLTRIDKDVEVAEDELPGYRIVRIDSHGSTMYTYVLLPDGTFTEPRPCVLLFHGFPGFVKNGDLAQALRRTGCVVVMPYHRGSWGSGGTYSFTHTIEDALAAAEWIRRPEIQKEYNLDLDKVFLAGHSMGGHTSLNAVRKLPWIKGMVLMAPYDLSYDFRIGKEENLKALIAAGDILKVDSPTSLFEDASAHWREYDFSQSFEAIKDKNLLFIGGTRDPLAPVDGMIKPIWDKLQAHPTTANQKYIQYPTTHGLDSHRNTLIHDVAAWVKEVADS